MRYVLRRAVYMAGSVWLVALSARAGVPPSPASIPSPPSAAAPFQDDEWSTGAESAPVVVVEYLSDTCAHCAAFERDVFPTVRSRYIDTGRLRYIVREMPTAPIAVSAAGFLLARCAGEARYWPVIEALLSAQSSILAAKNTAAMIARVAEVSGASAEDEQRCLSDQAAIDALNARRQAGFAAGVDGTPTFVFNGRMLKPGDRVGGRIYLGGELSREQFEAAYREALRRSPDRRAPVNHTDPDTMPRSAAIPPPTAP